MEFLTLDKYTGRLGDDNGELVALCAFLYYLSKLFNVEGVYYDYVFNSDSVTKLNEIDRIGILALKSFTCCCVILMSGHSGGTVVKDHNRSGSLVIYHIDQRVDTCVKEGGISNNCYPILNVVLALCLFHTVERGDAGTHTNSGVYNAEGSDSTESVATDIACRVDLQLVKHRVNASVGTTGAENGRTGGSFLLFKYNVILSENDLFEKIYAVFALTGKYVLALYAISPSANLIFDNGLELFENVYVLNLSHKIIYQLFGDGIYKTEFQNACRGECLLNVLICDAAGDKAELLIVDLHFVDRE